MLNVPNCRVAVAPYRIAPLGAHVDHQGGLVLGASIDDYSILAFEPEAKKGLTLRTDRFEHAVTADFESLGSPIGWGRYAKGAIYALQQQRPLLIGIRGFVTGGLIGAGLSSSASVGLAYLLALAAVNEILLTNEELVELDRVIENEYLGLNNGVQDQTMITYARADSLVYQDTGRRQVTYVPHPSNLNEAAWLVVYSGFNRELTASGFNDRVAQCREAARLLDPAAKILSSIPAADFFARRQELPEVLGRRAAHYFTEVARVAEGVERWRAGDWPGFGRLMNQSCHSSITQYESGSRPIIDLHEITSAQPGVWGSRFCGGGYGGCVVALVERNQVEEAEEAILERFLAQYPETEGIATAREVQMEGGPRIVEGSY
ncbi:MAG: galactokinase family protein [Ardenticatenaceae bacterium]|nr:galactokinase family protein [Ardenticatenaceae bacterium]